MTDPTSSRPPRIAILKKIASYWGVPLDEIKGDKKVHWSRKRRDTIFQIVLLEYALVCRRYGYSWGEIGQLVDRNFSSIAYKARQAERYYANSERKIDLYTRL